ncbi:MAG: DUF393 domain-containing protein [Actinomycetota bacterium]|nr:DUF393 domain-containing protein [Actinomycetota bacterium]MDP2287677.1 DUF393 domain-containing protein [Actinomycetota bacterium]
MIQGLRRAILFDGDCATCHRALNFIALRLPTALELSFVPLDSDLAKSLLSGRPHNPHRDSLVYLDAAELLQGAAAVKRVLSLIPRWRVVGKLLEVLPDALTESAYDVFAANRYRWNRRLAVCELPDARLAARLVPQ